MSVSAVALAFFISLAASTLRLAPPASEVEPPPGPGQIPVPQASPEPPEPIQLTALQCDADERGATVRIFLSRAAKFSVRKISNPDRVYLDFVGTALGEEVPRRTEVGTKCLTAIRTGQFSQDPLIARVVLDLPAPLPYQTRVLANGHLILLDLGEGGPSPFPWADPHNKYRVLNVFVIHGLEERTAQALIECTGVPDYHAFFLTDPPRVVIDIPEATLSVRQFVIPVEHPLLLRVRMSQFQPDTVRVVFDLRELAGYIIDRRPDPPCILIQFGPGVAQRRVIVVDAGHGGHDPGARGYLKGQWEKEVNLDLARRVATLLRQEGIVPMLTRSEDVFVSLQDRVRFANAGGADLFVSIHCNAFPRRGARCGIEIYYWTPHSRPFAEVMRSEVVKALRRPDRGVRQRMFYVVHHTVMPSVLVEVGYIDHSVEGRLLNTPEFRQRAAQGIVNGIKRYLQMQYLGETSQPEPEPPESVPLPTPTAETATVEAPVAPEEPRSSGPSETMEAGEITAADRAEAVERETS